MTSDNSGQQKFGNVGEYETQNFDQRFLQGISVDRSSLNSLNSSLLSLWNIKNSNPKQLSDLFGTMFYRANRKLNGWHTKRQMNKEIVDLSLVHNQIMDLAAPVIMDLLMEVKPTTKDLKNLSKTDSTNNNSKKNERTVRRNLDYFPHILGNRPTVRIHIRNVDGSITKYPQIPYKKDPAEDDKRLTSIMTNYSRLPWGIIFDAKDYVDFNYFIRLKKFWKSAIELLIQVYEKHGPIRKDMNWLVYHIVNNDVGLHVLFDNLSLECEARWFQRLGEEKRIQIAGLPGIESEPYWFTEEDATRGVLELKRSVQEFEEISIPSFLNSYKISKKTMRKRMLECGLAAADAYHKSGNYNQYELIMNEIDRSF